MIKELTCVILCGGKGTRLHPITLTTPKPMVDIAGKPHLHRQIDHVKSFGTSNIILSVQYLHDQIRNYFKDGSDFNVHFEYVEDGEMQLGTAGALRKCLDKIQSEYVLVMNGDILTDIDITKLFDVLDDNPCAEVIISGVKVDNPTRYGVMETDGSKVTRFVEKGGQTNSALINAGIYLIKTELLHTLPDNIFLMLETHVFPKCVERGTLYTYQHSSELWIDIGTTESYEEACKLFELN